MPDMFHCRCKQGEERKNDFHVPWQDLYGSSPLYQWMAKIKKKKIPFVDHLRIFPSSPRKCSTLTIELSGKYRRQVASTVWDPEAVICSTDFPASWFYRGFFFLSPCSESWNNAFPFYHPPPREIIKKPNIFLCAEQSRSNCCLKRFHLNPHKAGWSTSQRTPPPPILGYDLF